MKQAIDVRVNVVHELKRGSRVSRLGRVLETSWRSLLTKLELTQEVLQESNLNPKVIQQLAAQVEPKDGE